MHFQRANKQNTSIGSDNGLAPNMRKANVGTYDDIVHQRIYAVSMR